MNIRKAIRNLKKEKNSNVVDQIVQKTAKLIKSKRKFQLPLSERLKKGFSIGFSIEGFKVKLFIRDDGNTRRIIAKTGFSIGTLSYDNMYQVREMGKKYKISERTAECHPDDKFNLETGVIVATTKVLITAYNEALVRLQKVTQNIELERQRALATLASINQEVVSQIRNRSSEYTMVLVKPKAKQERRKYEN